MPESTERKTQNTEIINKLDITTAAITNLSHVVEMFVKVHEGEHCTINTKLDMVFEDVRGNGDKQSLKEKVNRLWDDAQSGKVSSRTVSIAIVICILTSVINLILK